MSSRGGQVVKGYELRERVGGGGFGEVYLAYQTLLKREVAIKIILPEHANQPEFIRRFEVEAELVARLEHPHIVPLFDYWRDAGGAFLVMRLLRGGSLEDLVDSGPVPVELVMSILDQIAGALMVAHRNGVVHRDLKPANILLDNDNNAYLADFGIAKDVSSTTQSDTMGLLTPNYAAPEQFKGEEVTPRTDIYNLGLMLYEMLTGQPPYTGTLHEVIFNHINDPVPSVLNVRPDLPPALDEVLLRATEKDPGERFPSALALAAAFKSAVGGVEVDMAAVATYSRVDMLDDTTVIDDTAALENPYKGLRAFREGDADDFFGRDDLTQRLLSRLDVTNGGARFLAVVGPSGSGKSSVVRAGLIPALRDGMLAGSDDWFISEMFPGAYPLAELEAALLRVAINPPDSLIPQLEEDERGLMRASKRILPDDGQTELVLLIDQFEELFTQVEDEAARLHFLNSLRLALDDPNARLRVIVTIRADFYDRPLQYEALGELMRRQTEVVLPLSSHELQAAIVEPIQRINVALETGLPETIADDVGEQPGTLPLLQYALTELFEHRQGRLLTLDAYRQIGGVTGALARRAEDLYRNFNAQEQDAVRQLFLRLVTLGEGAEDTRRRVRRTELGASDALDRVIETYGQYRLLTFDRDPVTRGPTVEVAHEALIRTWDRMRGWIEDSREDLRIQRRLTAAAAEWLGSGRNPDFLASGARLSQFEEWSAGTALVLNDDERNYLQTSIQEEAARRARDEATARKVQNLGRATLILGGMIVIAVIATLVLLNQANDAQSRAGEAQTQVALAGETLTPIPNTLTPLAEELLAGNAQLATAQNQVAVAQDQIENVGLTLTPAQGTAIAAQMAADAADQVAGAAQTQAAAAQAQVNSVGATLTPQQATVVAAQAQVENVGSTLTPVQGTVVAAQADALEANQLANSAQTQVAQVGATLTPVQATLSFAENQVARANDLADTAQTQVFDALQQVRDAGATLTPQQGTVVAAQQQVESVGATLTPQQATVVAAQALVEHVGATLTPVQGTVVAAQADALEANQLANSAQTQVAQVGATLTPVQATLAFAENQVARANDLADAAQTQVFDALQQVRDAGATLTPQQSTVVAAQAQMESVGATLTPQQATVVAAQAQVENVGATLTPVQGTVVAAQADALEANQLANSAQTQVAEVGLTLSPVQSTVVAAQADVLEANQLANSAQTQVAQVGLTLTPVPLTLTPVQVTLAAAQFQFEQANALGVAAQTQVAEAEKEERQVNETLTPVQATVVAAQTRVAQAEKDEREVDETLTPVQATIVAAQVLVENVGATLTPVQGTVVAAQQQIESVGATLTPQQATIAAAQLQAQNVGATLTPQQATIEAAEAQVANVGQTLTPVQATVVAARADAGSISLAVSAEQAVNNGNYDLALALVLESMKLNPALTQPQRLLNQIAFSSPRMSFDQARIVEFSPNNRVVVTAQDHTLVVWNIDSRQPIDQLQGHAGAILGAAFSANGQWLATASQDASVIVYDVSGWRFDERATELYRLTAHGGAVNAVTFNPESTILLTGGDDSQIISWEARTGAEIRRFTGNPWPVKALRYAEGGRDFFAWADANGTRILSLWNGANGNRIYTDDQLVFDTFSPNMRNAFIGGGNTPLQIRNAGSRALVREFVRGFNWGTDTAVGAVFRPFNGSEALIALDSSGGDSRLVLADVGSGEVIRRFQGDAAGRVNGLAFNPDGALALSGNGNQLVLWDVSRGVALRRLAAHNDLVDTIEFSPDGRFALSRSRDGNARIWDITSGDGAVIQQLRVPVEIPDRASPHIAGFHPTRNTIYSGVWIDLIEWSAQTGQHTGTVSVGAPIRNTLFSPTDPQVVTILENVAILWNLDQGTQGLIDRFANSNDLFNGAGGYSPNGAFLALDGRSQIYVYDMSTRLRIKSIDKPLLSDGYIVTGLAITPDGARVVGAVGALGLENAAAGDVIVWDVASGQELFRFPVEHTRTINHVSVSPDGRSVLTASDDNTLILWDLGSGQVLKRFAGHTDDVNVGLFSPDPARPFIISASDDATLILWDIDSGQPIRSFRGHTQGITGLNLSADGRRMVSTTRGDTLIVWRIESTEQIVSWTLANRYVRPLTADECNQYDVRDCNAQLDLAPVATLPAAGPTPTFLPTFTAVAPTTTHAPSERVFATNTGSQNVNVRSSDNTNAPIVSVLGVNERVEVLGQSNRGTGWLQIVLSDGRLAWVSGSVVSLDGDRTSIPRVEPPPVVPQTRPTQRPATDSGSSGSTNGGSGSTGRTEDQPTPESQYDCSVFRLTSPIGYINIDETTFYWDTLPGVANAQYWLTIFNEQGQNVAIANAGNASNVTIDTSIGGIGGGFAFSYEVNVFVDGVAVCPGSGSAGARPAS